MKKKANLIWESAKTALSHYVEKFNKEKEAEQLAILNHYNSRIALEIQAVLGDILSHTNISPIVSTIRSNEDVLPCGFRTCLEGNYYFFSLPKISDEPVSDVIVKRLMKNINQTIQANRNRMIYNASMMDDLLKVDYYMQNRLLYNGFMVVDSKDDYDRIMIAVSVF